MNYLETISQSLDNVKNGYSHNKACLVVETLLRKEKLKKSQRDELTKILERLKKCDYYEFWTHQTDYSKLHDFIHVCTELHRYIESEFYTY